MPVLQVENLSVEFPTEAGILRATDGLSFAIEAQEAFGLVGESGSGKSVTALAIMRLLGSSGHIAGGRIMLKGEDLLTKTDTEMQSVRGRQIGMIFQEPMTSLNPAFTVGEQIAEVFRFHFRTERKEAQRRAIEVMEKVKLPRAKEMYSKYPHELSGGMRQRVMIGIALSCEPDLLIADEPTTALDVTIQAQIVALLDELRREMGMALLFISHNLGVVAQVCQRVAVMYGARIMEVAPTATLFEAPAHPYTAGLLGSIPTRGKPLQTITGVACDLKAPPSGCRFHPRCTSVQDRCRVEEPPLTFQGASSLGLAADDRPVACHFPLRGSQTN